VEDTHENRWKTVYACEDAARAQHAICFTKEAILQFESGNVMQHCETNDGREAAAIVGHCRRIAALHSHTARLKSVPKSFGERWINFKTFHAVHVLPQPVRSHAGTWPYLENGFA
jgi:hypothetical protein